jgi:hypothetical protein
VRKLNTKFNLYVWKCVGMTIELDSIFLNIYGSGFLGAILLALAK